MRRRSCFAFLTLAVVIIAAAPAAHAQFWVEKAFHEWSLAECEKMLSDSPWARSYTIDRVFIETNVRPAAVPGSGREQTPRITYVARLLSAAPIRQAMVRSAQLDKRYPTLTPEQRQKVDARHKAILEESFTDNVVIQIEFNTNTLPYRGELAAKWQAQAEDVLKQQVFLFTPRGRISPERIIIDTTASSGEIQLIFPRLVNAQPLMQPGDKDVKLEFPSPAVGVLPADRVLLEFKVKNLLVNNALLY